MEQCSVYIANPTGGAAIGYLMPQSWTADGIPIEISLGIISRLQDLNPPASATPSFLAGWIMADSGLNSEEVMGLYNE